MARKLASDEQALWAKVVASVRPLKPLAASSDLPAVPRQSPAIAPVARPRPATSASAPARAPAPSANTLDGSWDRRLARGLVKPDMIVDLHGHNLAGAHALLANRIDKAIAGGARVILLITGKPPQAGRTPVSRGAIRAAVGDWLAGSAHARDIAAVRPAHPRHGGAGALYIILRSRASRHRQEC